MVITMEMRDEQHLYLLHFVFQVLAECTLHLKQRTLTTIDQNASVLHAHQKTLNVTHVRLNSGIGA